MSVKLQIAKLEVFLSEKGMCNKIFSAHVYSAMVSIYMYFVDIAHMTDIPYIHILPPMPNRLCGAPSDLPNYSGGS